MTSAQTELSLERSAPRSELVLDCPRCGAPVAICQVRAGEPARCAACGRLFRPSDPSRQDVRPAAFGEELHEETGRLEIRWPWWRWRRVGVIALAVAWNVLMLSGVVRLYSGLSWVAASLALVPLAPVLAAGLLLAWWAAATVANETRLSLDGERFRVCNGPLAVPPFLAPTRPLEFVAESELRQFFVQRVGQVAPGAESTGSPGIVRLAAVDRTGARRVLVTGLRAAEALWLESRIERHLGIVDLPVGDDGELR